MREKVILDSSSQRKTPQKKCGIVEIAAHRTIKPFRQGELDWFCGLYSCLNALRLAAHAVKPISRPLATQLYRAGIGYLDNKAAAGVTATKGMYPGRQRRLLAHLTGYLRDRGIEVAIERPEPASLGDIAEVFRWIEGSIAKGAPVMVYLDGSQDHYSVIAGIDEKHLHLFDSFRLCRITRAGCDTKRGRHILDPKNLIGVRAVAQTISCSE